MGPCAHSTPDEGAPTAWAQAQAWRDEPGLVFFDSAAPGPESRSMVARRPTCRLQGDLARDSGELETILEARKMHPSCGLSAGFLAGWIAYDGTFDFAVYEEALVFPARRAASGRRFSEPAGSAPEFVAQMEEAAFISRVRQAQELIAAGDIYQVNLSYPFRAVWDGDPFAYYAALREASPAPHACFLRTEDRSICSASPELFLDVRGRRMRTRPIKGTRPRGGDRAGDLRSSEELRASAKERAELIMITDLERSDLGQVCEFGSVTVSGLLHLEAYRQVFHLVSTVEGTLRPDVSHVTALRRCFPGGSITGAPKIRAMEIIAELEPFPRGIYTGVLGYFGFNGESQFNIAIRTAVAEEGQLHFHVGAGIVADSIPGQEYQETRDKALGLLAAAARLRSDASVIH